ncbi:MAG TPA: alpha-(1-_3)-arabinofuranosyltransferase family protein [Baekduia sp.]|nr:alpha-(1->3)-arabinofuranosyltransferase family protein [Baekduia sp.]
MRSRRSIPLAVTALAYAVALVQRPGQDVADTKVNLLLDPVRFLHDVASLWSPTTDLGHVWAGQYGGYLWPMAPWFAAGDLLGLPSWLVQRLWLGTLLAIAGWGVIRLLDALLSRRRGAVHLAAAVLFVVNPYVTVYAARQSIALLAYASLPWLLLCVHRGLREPRRWRWPALFALVLTTAGGGVNAGLTGWVLVGPLLLLVYDRLFGGVDRRAVGGFLLRMVPLTVLANVWWVVPVLLSSRAAPNFLAYTEQPGTIWGTTSLSESLRLMGFWTSYVGNGFAGYVRPYQGSAPALLFLLPVVVAGLLVPAAGLSALPWTRRWRYAPFFALLALVGLLVMTTGWPEGTPLRELATGAYYRVQAIQFLRTTYKAGALTALGLAVLGGAAFGLAWRWAAARWAARQPAAGGLRGLGPLRLGLAVVAAGLVALSSWPLVTGRALEGQLAFDLPASWRRLAADLDQRPDRSRAAVFPGQLFASYDWGGTVDPVLPALTEHPVVQRWIVPFADLRSADLQFTVDSLVTQERLRPGQLPSLLDLLGVGDVVVAADGNRRLSGEMPAGDAARELAGLGRGTAYGPAVRAQLAAGDLEPAVTVPALRRVEVPTGGIVRVLRRGPMTVVDGASGGLTGLAAYGALDPQRPIAYGPDLGAAGIRAAARSGASLVISDTNRRRAFVAARSRGQAGPTLPADQSISADGTMLDPFPGQPASGETVAVIRGIRSVSAPASPQVTQLPDQRPFAALDGDPETAWIADRLLVPVRPTLTIDLGRARDVGAVDLLPYSDSRGVVRAVTINGKRFAVHRGWNHLVLGLHDVRTLVVHLADVTRPVHHTAGAGGIRELRIPGVHASEALRPPTDVEDAVRGTDLRTSALTYLLDRTTADVPYRRGRYAGERSGGELRDAQDPERRLVRLLDPPAARRYQVDGWATIDPRTPDHRIDLLAGGLHRRAGATGADLQEADSSSRYQGLGRYRASGAFDGGTGRGWIGQWIAGRPAWLSWSVAQPVTVRRLVLARPDVLVRRPTRVALSVDGRRVAAVDVGAGGAVVLPRAVTGRRFRLDVLDARFPAGTSGFVRQRRAVGIAEVRGAGVAPVAAPRGRTVALPCGAARLEVDGGRSVALRGSAPRAALDDGRPLHVRGCGAALALPARQVELRGSTAPLRLDGARLASPAPGPKPLALPAGGGRVLDAGSLEPGSRDGVRVSVRGPSWLVLGASYDRYWRASCDGHDLGEPRPMQGYANAWPVDRGCHAVTFTYGLQRVADAGYLVSAVVCAALLALLAVGVVRRRRRGGQVPAPVAAGGVEVVVPAARPLPAGRALAVALPAAAFLGLCFGLRAGAVGGPLLWLVLWRGVPDRWLGRAAAALLVLAVPVSYALVALIDGTGHLRANATKYPGERISGHWLALAGVVCVAVVLGRTLVALRAAERGSRPPAEEGPVASGAVPATPDPSLR